MHSCTDPPRFVDVVGGAVARDVAEYVVVVVPVDTVWVLARRLRWGRDNENRETF